VITIRYRAGPAAASQSADPEMARVLYTAQATVTGGRASGHGSTNDGALDVQLRTPKEMGGEGGGTNPEQLFAVGYAACFESAPGVIGRREHAKEIGDPCRFKIWEITSCLLGFTNEMLPPGEGTSNDD
jgi:hypothetical protein